MTFQSFELDEFTPVDIDEVSRILSNPSVPIGIRMRCLFKAKSYGGADGVNAILRSLETHHKEEVLFRHEACYALGQIGPELEDDRNVYDVLRDILCDEEESSVTRHEAAESLGNFGGADSISVLEQFEHHHDSVVRETVQLALHKQRELEKPDEEQEKRFKSVDPSEPFPNMSVSDIPRMAEMLCDRGNDIVSRYRALFTLRDLALDHPSAEKGIVDVLNNGYDDSALLLHEVAFVAGQIASPMSSDRLIEVTEDAKLHGMIRHESAIALGSIATGMVEGGGEKERLARILHCLREQSVNTPPIVADSCKCAIYNHELDTAMG